MHGNRLVLVTGGTGNLGRRVVARLHAAGHRVRVVSRHPRDEQNGVEYVAGDLASNEGVDAAVDGADIVIHCAAVGKVREDTAQARNLVNAAGRAGVRHAVNVSVVGAERIPVESAVDRAMFAYFKAQRDKEVVFEASGLPWSNLRATQFHDGFILAMVRGMSKLPVVPLPADTRFQPVDTDEVADALTELAFGAPAGHTPAIAGPKVYEAEYLMRSYLDAIGKRRAIWKVRMPGAAAAAIRAGANLAPDRAVGRRTWEEFLDTQAARQVVPQSLGDRRAR